MGLVLLFVSAFVTGLSGALMPGPVLFVTIRHTAEKGRVVGPLIVAGHAAVEVPLMLAVIFGLGSLLKRPVFTGVVGLAGGALLLLLSAQMLRSLPGLHLPDPDEAGDDGGTGALGIIGAGAATSVANPYFPLWWATMGMRFLAGAAAFAPLGYVVFYAGHILSDLGWYAAVAEGVHRGRRILSDRGYRWLVGVCAVLLAGFAVWFGIDGVKHLLRAG